MTSLADAPRYFHLLSERELSDLKPALQILGESRDTVLARWYEKYLAHFGPARTLSETDFLELYGRDLDAVVRNLTEGDMEGFEADVRAIGHELVARGVPFVEVVASVHLFEESASEHFQPHLRVMVREPSIFLTFDKLSHCRMILLVGTYFEGQQARTSARVAGLELEAERLAGTVTARTSFHGIVGQSPVMRGVYEQIAAASGGQGAVLVAGESGTGKELVARALHECRGEPGRPFIVVNCAALPRELIESELFGHRRGAYTGAQVPALGLVRAAEGGTLFLDEITEMAPETQAKLLRVIEERKVRPVGTEKELSVDVRFVASTNRDPDLAVSQGILRKDLYYRLSVHRIVVPPLRERPEDVALLAEYFSDLLARMGLRRVESIDGDALHAMAAYRWPGNVRELRNAVEHALTFSRQPTLRLADLPPHVAANGHAAPRREGAGIPTMAEAERDLIQRALEATGGNKLQTARMLRISRHCLYDKLKKYGVATA